MSTDDEFVPPPPSREPRPFEPDEDIGTATLLEDGTLRLMLRAEAADGTLGEAMLFCKPTDEDYASTLAHLGPLAPGESVPVKPFPPSSRNPNDESEG